MKTIAIVGTGIAGMGCAYFLHKKYNLTIFEKNNYIGGHTNTIPVQEYENIISIDTGFIVYNKVTYPNFIRLIEKLEVPTKPTSMSFSVQHVPSGLEFCGSGLDGIFAQRKNIFKPSFVKMILQINRFNKESLEILENEQYDSYTLAEYVAEKNYGEDFLYKYLIPMSSAVWSTPIDTMLHFPAKTLIRFFYNHGFLGLDTQHQWYTIVNGSKTYREKLIAPFKEKIHTNTSIVKVEKETDGVLLTTSNGEKKKFDMVIIAAHANEALAMLAKPTEQERKLLSPFQYQKNVATLHTDSSVMPKNKKVWSSWNYRIEEDENGKLVPSTIYSMNHLQQVSQKKEYFISIDTQKPIKQEAILWQTMYEHPIFSLAAINAQKELSQLNENGKIYFCGSYCNYGFHEDAFTSAIEVSQKILGEDVWN